VLVHICCSVDSHFFLERLQREFADEKLTGFFYNPNIHPYSEYRLRLLDVERSCALLDIELITAEYDYETWLELTKGLESEPEKGKRCEVCFDRRFEVSAQKAVELGEKSFTTTLLVSPLKSQQQLKKAGDEFYKQSGVKFISVDYRSGGGTQEQSLCAKEHKLYRQDYCGCLYGLNMQRTTQDKTASELYSPIDAAVLPGSIEQRIELYERRVQLENQDRDYEIVKERFLNYRQLHCSLSSNSEKIDVYALHYSTLPRAICKATITKHIDHISYLSRDNVRLITLEYLNRELLSSYATIQELLYNPPPLKDQLRLREIVSNSPYSLSPIIVTKNTPKTKMVLRLQSRVYQDTVERLIVL